MNGCSHEKIFTYRGIIACKECNIVFGPQFKIKDDELSAENSKAKDSINLKSEFTNSKKFSISIKFQTS
ncbi:MAG: hypothetical protein ACFFCM_02420 [Promethearchaeota archaeon]